MVIFGFIFFIDVLEKHLIQDFNVYMHSGWIYIPWGKVDFPYFLFFVYLTSNFTLSFTTFLGFDLFYCVQLWSPPHKRHGHTGESPTNMSKGLEPV